MRTLMAGTVKPLHVAPAARLVETLDGRGPRAGHLPQLPEQPTRRLLGVAGSEDGLPHEPIGGGAAEPGRVTYRDPPGTCATAPSYSWIARWVSSAMARPPRQFKGSARP